jgi:hypothetical protein
VARAFRRSRSRYRCRLEPAEAFVIRRLAQEVGELVAVEAGEPPAATDALQELTGMLGEPPPRSEDPAVVRLFPDAYADAEQATEFRRYTLHELSAGKRAGLAALHDSVPDDGGEVALDEEAAQIWMSALNDMRLVVGTRLGVTEDNVDELAALGPEDARALLYAVYELLTFLQGTLVEAVAGW